MGFFPFIFCDGTILVLTNTSPVLFLALLLISFIHNTAFKIITSFFGFILVNIFSCKCFIACKVWKNVSNISFSSHFFVISKITITLDRIRTNIFFDSKILCRSSSLSLTFSAADSTGKFSSKSINTLTAQCVSLTGNLFVGESIWVPQVTFRWSQPENFLQLTTFS